MRNLLAKETKLRMVYFILSKDTFHPGREDRKAEWEAACHIAFIVKNQTEGSAGSQLTFS